MVGLSFMLAVELTTQSISKNTSWLHRSQRSIHAEATLEATRKPCDWNQTGTILRSHDVARLRNAG